MKSNKKGIHRIVAAFFYSLAGLRAAFKHEAAFRQEAVVYIILLPVILILPVSDMYKCLLFIVNSLVLIVELLNSGMEAIVDMVSPDYNVYAKRAKDMGSAAVLLSLLLAGVIWGMAILSSLCSV
ncbi:diacylglycerol kinase [Desulfosediminicola flagellatus]|uniref:diacylglycerol kinase n=1 Tax=Desulfosediminicola flagellatus TaxID=2569541 RepID=UPI0010AD3E39|nr:diacylglycerol kinase [Desulfosediminicola flagellatus]